MLAWRVRHAPTFNDMERQRAAGAVFATGICTIHRTNNITQTLWLMQSTLSIYGDALRRLQLQSETHRFAVLGDYSVQSNVHGFPLQLPSIIAKPDTQFLCTLRVSFAGSLVRCCQRVRGTLCLLPHVHVPLPLLSLLHANSIFFQLWLNDSE